MLIGVLLLTILLFVAFQLGADGGDDDVTLVDPDDEPQTVVVEPDPQPTVVVTTETEVVVAPQPTETVLVAPSPAPAPTADGPGRLLFEEGEDLFPIDAAQLQANVGEDVVGDDVAVESIVEGVGFWVGSGPGDRLFVRAIENEIVISPDERYDLVGVLAELSDPEAVPDEQGGEERLALGVDLLIQGVAPAE